MKTAFSTCEPSGTDWKVLYRSALYETDKSVGLLKVAEAEKAVLDRERELFYVPSSLEEREDLEDALYALHALRSAWQHAMAA